MTVDVQETLKFIKEIKRIKNTRNTKKVKEKWIDFYYREKNGKCEYCSIKKTVKKMQLIKKIDDTNSNRIKENKRNIALICNDCKRRKKDMNHYEFKSYLKKHKRKIREEYNSKRREIKEVVLKAYNRECIFCVYEFGKTPQNRHLTIDHKKPIKKLGTNHAKNLSCVCMQHNSEKGTMDAAEYFEYLRVNNRKKKKGVD